MTAGRNLVNTVADVPRLNLCTSCGVCQGICPTQAITMRVIPGGTWAPAIDEARCTHCGLCRRSCSGLGYDFPNMQQRLFGEAPGHVALGNYTGLYAGHCTDTALRWKSQSGGVVSALLLQLLESRAITGALLVRWNPERPMRAEPYIARTRDEILQATGSKYCPVPTGKLTTDLMREKGRFAVVGPSCLIQSIRKAEVAIPALSEKIHIRIGLFCLNVFTLPFYDYLPLRQKLTVTDIASFEMRSKVWRGWPGNARLITRSGRAHNIPAMESRIIPRPFFSAWRCNLCVDKANEFADLSCGDCRVARHYGVDNLSLLGHKHPGLSDIIVRTRVGAEALQSAVHTGEIEVTPSSADEIADSVRVSSKKIGFASFAKQARRLGWGVPLYGLHYMPASVGDRALAQAMRTRTERATRFHALVCQWRRHNWYPRLLAMIPNTFLHFINRRIGLNASFEKLGKCHLDCIKGEI